MFLSEQLEIIQPVVHPKCEMEGPQCEEGRLNVRPYHDATHVLYRVGDCHLGKYNN